MLIFSYDITCGIFARFEKLKLDNYFNNENEEKKTE